MDGAKRKRDEGASGGAADADGFLAPPPLSRLRATLAAAGRGTAGALETDDAGGSDGEGDGGEEDEEDAGPAASSASATTREQVREALDTMEGLEVPTMDLPTLRRMLLKLEKGISKNQQLRIKYAGDPDKFMESEMDLDEDLKKFQMLATAPHLYADLVALNAVGSIIGLLAHENTDISIDVVDLLKELTDSDNSAEDTSALLIDALLEHQALELLVQNMRRLDESVAEESQGVYNTLALFENLLELRYELADPLAIAAGFFGWALKRLQSRTFDQNKQYTSELLAILLQTSKAARLSLGEQGGMDVLLQAIAVYKRKDPAGVDEVELLENLFDCLCSTLLEGDNRPRFLKAEGVELMIILIKEKKMARSGALKTLSYAMNGAEGASIANRFVDALGLPSFFPALMGKMKGALGAAWPIAPPQTAGKLKKSYKDFDEDAEEEHAISIVTSLFQHLRGLARDRLLNKFAENELEKLDRLIELHFKYTARVAAGDAELERKRQKFIEAGDEEELEELEEELYVTRLDNGLFRLQQVDLSMAYISVSGIPEAACRVRAQLRSHCDRMLRLKGASFASLATVLEEYANNVGETAPEPIRERQRAEVRDLIAQLVPSTEASTGATDAEAGTGASASSSTSASASAANGDGEGTDV